MDGGKGLLRTVGSGMINSYVSHTHVHRKWSLFAKTDVTCFIRPYSAGCAS